MMNFSSVDEYKKANRLAKAKYSADILRGNSGHISSLDSILKKIDIVAEIPLGLKNIPLKKIVGTYFYTRSRDFANNFLPLASISSEFASKWESVYAYHIKDGIDDPIKIYEYMNEFYVMEGNKRVSILKYVDAYSIDGEVTRLVPKRDENDLNNIIYYEFLEFNNKTGINDIWFSKEGGFTLLGKYLDEYKPKLYLFSNKYKHFIKNVYFPFKNTFYELGGDKLDITTGDAFLEYVKIYGISNEFIETKRKVRVEKFLAELRILTKNNAVDIQTEPFDVHKKNVITSITNLVTTSKKLKVAFVFEKTIDTSGWTYVHNLGRIYALQQLGNEIETFVIDNFNAADDEEGYERLSKLCEKDYDIIFTTCPSYLNITLRAALKYDNIKFFNCSPVKAYRNVSTYFGRSHEPRFLLGLIAGAITKSNIIGYIDTYNETEIITGINAFALGVKTVNSNAKVLISWLNQMGDISHSKQLMQELQSRGADLIMQNDLIALGKGSRDFGLYSLKYNENETKWIPEVNYALITWDWGQFYEKILRNIVNGSFKGIFSTESKRVSFWWGMDSELVDIIYSKHNVPIQTQKLVDIMREMIIENKFHTFAGPIFDRSGQIRIEDGDIGNYEDMLYMEWFVDNVVGEIPKN
ncbi:BMP family ABC transporter substrate-binding protein [Clostridium estertheticum]|uniref:BMP family ABC transporter substrate-binding protein n=1 Tax=Clostridium estertheticum TaxID=238834 RepID=UPI001C6EBEBB|nr:BMP family ABC transporter substrate-binding protein [Clostridium estertheticum]MBW9151227.1 BMP family ABC transporter substrate-binding protein [Clostridium estertheticum]WLC84788.1 BMP family ABC transporter substrate-binding protein [Clostridium estertheticum]